jgi:broad specificity phosphatase PhoE
MDLHAQEPREARILARIHRSFGGVVLAVFDSERGNCIAFACHGSALRTLHRGQLQRPQGFDPEVWPSLQCDMARVLGAWREEFA